MDGQKYFIKGKEDASSYILSGYTYYAAGFSEILYRVATNPETKERPRALMESEHSIYIAYGCESCLLRPSRPVVYLSILDDIVN